MVKLDKSFWDGISEKPVYYWQDYYFNIYLANNKFGYRIKIK